MSSARQSPWEVAAYRNLVSQGRYAGIETALFINTGGTPSLFTAAVEQMA